MVKTGAPSSIVGEAHRILKTVHGVRVVCTDNLPDDHEIALDREKAVQRVVDETLYWENRFGINEDE